MPLGKVLKGGASGIDEQAAFEQRKKEEIQLRSRLEELLQEETDVSRTNSQQIQCRWIKWAREQKLHELSGDIEILRHSFEKTLDRKNAVIAMLSADMEEAEEQYRLAFRAHLSNIDALIDLQNRRTTDLDVQFESDLLQLKTDFELERAEMQRKHDLEKGDLKLILSNMLTENEREDRKLQEDTSESDGTAAEKLEEEFKAMSTELSKVNETLRLQIDERFNEFVNNATVNMKEYTEKTKNDEEAADKIASQMRKIQKLQESILTCKSNLSNNIRECEERNSALKAEKETTARHFKELKAKMQLWRKEQEKRLAELVSNAQSTKLALEKKSQSVERMLRLVELCRQLETEREKVLRFDSDVAAEEIAKEVKLQIAQRKAIAENSGDDAYVAPAADAVTMEDLFPSRDVSTTASASEEWKLLERFWLKYNRVLLDNAAIAQERFHLKHENQKLRMLLKQYLDGISVNQDVMSQRNNLLQSSTFQNAASTGAGRQQNVLEGNKVIMEIAKQRAY